jgi:uncharacterized membrane protein YhaH (DUF805 family)
MRTFYNQSGRVTRIFFWIAAGMFLMAAPCVPVILRVLPSKDAAVREASLGWVVMGMFLASMGGAALLIALLTWPVARRAERAFAAFQAGDYLVHWEYPEEFWKAAAAAEEKIVGKSAWVWSGLMMLMCLFPAMMGIWLSPDVKGRGLWTVMAVMASGLVSLGIFWLVRRYGTRKGRRMRQYPEAFVAKDSAYCAGEFLYWNTRARSLHGIRILADGSISITVGMSKAVAGITGTVDLVNLVMLHPSNVSQQVNRLKIAVPPGEAMKAEEVVRAIITAAQEKIKR